MRRSLVVLLTGAALVWVGCDKDEPAPSPTVGTPGEKAPDGPAAAPKTPAGKVLAPKGEPFKIEFPAGLSPTREDQNVASPAGPMTVKVWMAEMSDGAYLINYTELPAGLLAGGNAKKYLEGGRDGALRNMGAKLEKEEEFELLGYPGLRFWFSGSAMGETIHARTDAIFVTPRLYQIQAIATTDAVIKSKKTLRFFDSFELVGVKAYEPKVYKPEDGSFQIAFPPSYPDPKATTEESEIPGGKLPITMAMSATPKGALSVGFADSPGEGELTKQNFDDARDGLLRNAGAKLGKEEDIELAGLAGRRVWFAGQEQGQDFHGRVDILGQGRRLYLIQALTPSKEQLVDAQIEAFFKSFAVSAKQPDAKAGEKKAASDKKAGEAK